MEKRNGIAVAGTILVDKLYEISAYPNAGELTQIRSITMALGGLVPNDGIDLKRIRPDLPVFAIGKVGGDSEGQFVLDTLKNNGLNIDGVIVDNSGKTSFTDVMSVTGGQRTFFTYPGVSATFGESDINWDALTCKMLHLGYFLLLDAVDKGEGLKILKKAKELGISTSIDLVSENSDRYSCVVPCLPYVDNLIINELEAGKLCGIQPTDDNLVTLAKKLLTMGVKERVIIHTPDIGICVTGDSVTTLESWPLPKGFKKGSTGAGDAFCAGALAAIHEGLDNDTVLKYAQMTAVASLRAVDATSGVVCLEELLALADSLTK